MDGPLEDRDVMFNPISPKEALVDFVKRRDEQLTRLKMSNISEATLKNTSTIDEIFQLSLKLLKDVSKLTAYIKREENLVTDITNKNFEQIFEILKSNGEITSRSKIVKALSQVSNAIVIVDRNAAFLPFKVTTAGKLKPTTAPDWLNKLCVRKKIRDVERMITDGNSNLNKHIEVIFFHTKIFFTKF